MAENVAKGKKTERATKLKSSPGSVSVSMGFKPSVSFCSIDFNATFTQELLEGESLENGFKRTRDKAEAIMELCSKRESKFLWDQIEESKKHAK